MPKQIVEVGNTGQQLVDKLKNNFNELYTKVGEIPTVDLSAYDTATQVTAKVTAHDVSDTSHQKLIDAIEELKEAISKTANFPLFFYETGLNIIAPTSETNLDVGKVFQNNVPIATPVLIKTFTADDTTNGLDISLSKNAEFTASFTLKSNVNYTNAIVYCEVFENNILAGTSSQDKFSITNQATDYHPISVKGIYNRDVSFSVKDELSVKVYIIQNDLAQKNIDVSLITSNKHFSVIWLNADSATLDIANITVGGVPLEDVLNGKIEEAPKDGKQYARKDGVWDEVESNGGGGTAINIKNANLIGVEKIHLWVGNNVQYEALTQEEKDDSSYIRFNTDFASGSGSEDVSEALAIHEGIQILKEILGEV